MLTRTAIARYRQPTTIQKPKTTGQDSFNTIDQSNNDKWDDVTNRLAEVMPTGGREFFAGQQIQAEVTHLVRYRQDTTTEQIAPEWRIRFGGRYLNVVRAYSVHERGREIELQCVEKVD